MAVDYATYATPRADLARAFMEYAPEGATFIADAILPPVMVSTKTGTYTKITRESILKRANAKRQMESGYNRISIVGEDATWACEERGLEYPVGDDVRAMYKNDFDVDMIGVKHLRHKLLLEREYAVKSLIQATTYTSGGATLYTDVSSAPWDAVDSDAIGHVADASEIIRTNSGVQPDTLVISRAVLANLLSNTALVARFPGAAAITQELLMQNMAAVFGLTKLVVGNVVYDTTEEGVASTLSDLWTDDYAFICKTANPGDPIDVPSVGRTFVWMEDSSIDLVYETYREEQIRSTIHRARQHVDEVLIESQFGHLLKVDA